mgnify:CR=1 FL=1
MNLEDRSRERRGDGVAGGAGGDGTWLVFEPEPASASGAGAGVRGAPPAGAALAAAGAPGEEGPGDGAGWDGSGGRDAGAPATGPFEGGSGDPGHAGGGRDLGGYGALGSDGHWGGAGGGAGAAGGFDHNGGRHAWWSRLVTALVGGLLGGGLVLYAVTAGPLAAAPGVHPGAGAGEGPSAGPGSPAVETPAPPVAGAPVVDFSRVYAQVAPSVVRVVRTARGISPWLGIVQEESSGSGVVIDDHGHVVTNYHVVEGASRLMIVLDDGTQVEARLVAQDPSHDLALLQADLPADKVRPARLGDSDRLTVGEPVMAVGYPFGLPKTATTGVISGLHRNNLQAPNGRIIREVIQTDAPINPGNSGGALVNARGEVIGINTAILSNVESRPGSIGIGFAVPINILKRELDLFLAGGTVQHPWLGIGGVEVDPATYRARGLAVDHGIQVAEVVPGSPADRAGLQAAEPRRVGGSVVPFGGDVILAVDGQAVRSVPDLVAYLDQKRVGDRVTLRINRDGQELQVPVVLGAFPEELGNE